MAVASIFMGSGRRDIRHQDEFMTKGDTSMYPAKEMKH
jgi:hypothetical protein